MIEQEIRKVNRSENVIYVRGDRVNTVSGRWGGNERIVVNERHTEYKVLEDSHTRWRPC